MKALMVCLGLESGAAGWKTHTNPLSYGGTPVKVYFKWAIHSRHLFFFTYFRLLNTVDSRLKIKA